MDSRMRPDPSRRDLDPDASPMFSIIGVLVAAALAIGTVVYFMRSGPSTTASNSPPVTTGQGNSRTMAPVVDQVKPAPAGPAAADDPAKQGVDAEAPVTVPPKP